MMSREWWLIAYSVGFQPDNSPLVPVGIYPEPLNLLVPLVAPAAL